MKDPAFKAEVDKAKAEFNPLNGEGVQKLIAEVANASPAMVARMQKYLQAEGDVKKAK
jgi:hypothetical protein